MERVLSTPQVCDVLSISRIGWLRLRQRGEGPQVQPVGSGRAITERDFVMWLAGISLRTSRTCRSVSL
jgi:hypothetical protein